MKAIVIIDDHRMLGESVALELLRREIATANVIDPAAPDAVEQLLASNPDACLIDLDLGAHQAGGMRYLREAVAAGIPAAMLTGSDREVQLGRCLEEGAAGIILKSLPFAEVAERVSRLLQGVPVNTDTELLGWVLAAQRFRLQRAKELRVFDTLTERECVVLEHIIGGLRASSIAAADHVSVATVRGHVRSVLQKLGVHSQIEAVALARQMNWTKPKSGDDG